MGKLKIITGIDIWYNIEYSEVPEYSSVKFIKYDDLNKLIDTKKLRAHARGTSNAGGTRDYLLKIADGIDELCK